MKTPNFFLMALMALTITIGSCSSKPKHESRQPAGSDLQRLEVVFPEELESYLALQSAVEKATLWKEQSKTLFANLHKETLGGSVPFTSLQMRHILQNVGDYNNIRQDLEKIANKYWGLVEQYETLEYALFEFNTVMNPNFVKSTTLKVDPSVEPGEKLLMQISISLAARITMLECDIIGLYPFFKDDKLRHTLTREDEKARRLIQNAANHITDFNNKESLGKARDLVLRDYIYRHSKGAFMPENRIIRYTSDISISSPYFKDEDPKIRSSHVANRNFKDQIYYLERRITFVLSYIFGNFVGLFKSRNGKLLKLSDNFINRYAETLQPLDIFLEKSPYRLTDVFIPGYYGHVAVWLGTEKQLRDLGLWDHPAVKKYQKQIRQGKSIIQAERSGVEVATFKKFLDADDLLHLRPGELPTEVKKRYLINAFQQIGKPYDFNFDVETDKRIVCSEIVYVIFDDMAWPTSNSLDRYTISPDQVAIQALDENSFFTPVAIFNNGKQVSGTQEFYRRALNAVLSENEEEIKKIFPPGDP